MRYFLYFAYNGTGFHGWQKQPNAVSVQEVMENALSVVLRSETSLTAAGRTDAGVHAAFMVAHFDTITPISDKLRFCFRMNSILPPAIAVSDLRRVSPSAHARFDAVSRKYEYRTTMQKDPFCYNLTTPLPKNLDFSLMNRAAERLLTQTDFASFCKDHCVPPHGGTLGANGWTMGLSYPCRPIPEKYGESHCRYALRCRSRSHLFGGSGEYPFCGTPHCSGDVCSCTGTFSGRCRLS